MKDSADLTVLIRGAGEVASGIAHRLHLDGYQVCLTEVSHPLAVCRGITFSEAIFDTTMEIMGVIAEKTDTDTGTIRAVWERGNIPVIIDPETTIKTQLKPDVLIDALMAKRNTGISITDAPLVIGLGPGFYAGRDVHLIIETSHEHELGKIITEGEPAVNTGNPIPVGGLARERVVWADQPGLFTTGNNIGDRVESGQEIAQLDGRSLVAPVSGWLRGLLRDGVRVKQGAKLIEIDHVHNREICFVIADKMKAIADAVLKAIKTYYNR
jgi:xanthine dehydrogenase accessory factor